MPPPTPSLGTSRSPVSAEPPTARKSSDTTLSGAPPARGARSRPLSRPPDKWWNRARRRRAPPPAASERRSGDGIGDRTGQRTEAVRPRAGVVQPILQRGAHTGDERKATVGPQGERGAGEQVSVERLRDVDVADARRSLAEDGIDDA